MVVRRLSLYAAVAAACVISFSLKNSAQAQSNASPDRAAGRMVDSLFDPNAPASLIPDNSPKLPPRRGVQRPTLKAKLVRNSDAKEGAPKFALVDKYGGILRYVEPVDKVKLEPYVGRIVGVRHDTGDTLLASQLIFPTGTRPAPRAANAGSGVQQAAFQEPIPAGKSSEETLLEPTPANEPEPAAEGETYSFDGSEEVYSDEGASMYEGGMYQGGMYEEGMGMGCPGCENGTCSLHVGHGYRRGGAAAPRSRAYLHGEYLLWWFDGMDTPPLVTTSNADDEAKLPNFPGENNQAGNPIATQIAYGQDPILEDPRSGVRIMLGVWVDECNKQAIEGDYLYLAKVDETFSLAGVNGLDANGQEFWIGRPFFNLRPITADGPYPIGLPREAAEDVSSDLVSGSVTVYSSSEFQGAGVRLRHNLCRSGCPDVGCGDCVDCGVGIDCGGGVGCGSGVCGGDSRFVDFLTGFRWYQLNETLEITERLTANNIPNPPIPPGTTFFIIDHFSTENDFVGGELGFDWGIERNRYSLELLSKIGIGSTRQSATIWGYTEQAVPNAPPAPPTVGTADEGILALSTNSGTFDRNRFSMIPEVNLTAGYKLTQHCKLRVGYTLLYWTNVLRPGDIIDREVNSTLVPGGVPTPNEVPRRPAFAFNETNVLIQGLNAGVEYNW